MRVFIHASELYPYYVISPPTERTDKYSVDVPQEALDRWKEAKKNFLSSQEEIARILGKADLLDKV